MLHNNLDYSSGPHLVMVIEPETKVRFRYESEGASHGGLLGHKENKKKGEKVYPTVKLEGYEEEKSVYIRVSLCTEDKKPHVFEFIGQSEESTPYAKEYLQEDNTVTFKNLKFLSKKKEEICDILLHKKMEELRNNNKCVRAQLKKTYSKEFNETARNIMNSVRLCFEAFEDDNEDIRLCEPLYSDPIYNQKAASKGKLKIHRISTFTGSWKGGGDMILLCDKVQKENIEIHFFETDSNQEIIWKTNANFSPVEVHYQVAIYFKIPPYRENSDRIVSIRLARNGEYSEPVEFKYLGDYNENPSKKRKRYAESVYQSSPENVKAESSSSSSCNAETYVHPIFEEQNQMNNQLGLLDLKDLRMSDAEIGITDFSSLLNYVENSNKCYSEVFPCEDPAPPETNYELIGSNLLTSNHPQFVPQGGEMIKGQLFDFGSHTLETINLLYTDAPQDDIDGGHAVEKVDVFAVKQDDELSSSILKSENKFKTSNHTQFVPQGGEVIKNQVFDLSGHTFEAINNLLYTDEDDDQDDIDGGHAVEKVDVFAVKQDNELSSSSLKSVNKSKTSNHTQFVPQGGEVIKNQVFDLIGHTFEAINVSFSDEDDDHEDDQDDIDGGHTVEKVDVFAVKQDELFSSSLKSENKSKTSNHNQIFHQKVKEKIHGHLMKRNEFGNTFLHTAVCKLASIKTIKSILQLIKFAHAEIINEKNFYQETALQFAVEQNNVELIKTLLRHGCNPNLTNAEGNNCYHIASECNYVDAMNCLLTVAKYSQQEDYKLEINAFNYEGLTPLHISVMKHSEDCYHLLKLHLGEVNICYPKSGKTLLHYAVEFHPTFVAILLKENDIEVNIQDFGGNTPLHIACATGKIEVVKQLLKAGADPSLKNYKQNCNTLDEENSEDDMDGQTPADVTTNFEILKILKQEPCNISGPDEIVKKLCDLLDIDMKWKAIATFVIDEKYINSLLCSQSPTRALLQHMKKEYKDNYIEHLKSVLEITGPYKALKIIQENHF